MATTLSRPSQALETLQLQDSSTEQWINRQYQEVLEDPDDILTIDDILGNRHPGFKSLDQDVLNMGHTDSSVWIHVRLQALADDPLPRSWLLQLKFPLLERVDIYTVRQQSLDQQYRLGYAIPMTQRPVRHRFFVQPLQLTPGETVDVYLNIMRKSGAVQAPLSIATPGGFFFTETRSNHIMGIYFGIMIAMIVYNFFLLFSVGKRAYLYYIAYISFTILLFQTFTGYGYLFLWPDKPWVNPYITHFAAIMAIITGILFARNFIHFERYLAWLPALTNGIIVLGLGLLLTRLFTDYFLSLEIAAYCALTVSVLPILIFLCWRRGSRQAGIFLVAWGLFLVGVLLFTCSLVGLLPSNDITNNGIIIGSGAEVLLLSLGLADYINSERRDKYKALQEQNQAILQLKEAEDRLVHRALHSLTTGLPNRTFLRNVLDTMIDNNGDSRQFSLLLVSLNNFHEFNKTLGHSNGDAILRLITERLSLLARQIPGAICIEATDTRRHFVAGVEGVTFAILLDTPPSSHHTAALYPFMQGLEKPFDYHELSLHIDATCGLALYPDHGNSSENLMRSAQIALEAASGNKQKIAEYSPDIDPYNARRLSLLGELRHAIDNNVLQLYFQPQINLHDLSVAGAEVLIRWIHPEYGFIPPDEFIPLAERTGVIHPLTYWICRQAFEFKRALELKGSDIQLSINISARNLQDPQFVHEIEKIAEETGVSLHRIIMELTETAVMADPEDALRVLRELNGLGIRLSIDDFGTGYSSLSYLSKLPVDEIKIDRSFVMEMAKSNDDQMIVHTTLTMGHNLSMDVVAEGIEDASTLSKLRDMGCDLAQGYHIAKPMPGKDFLAWLERYPKGVPAAPDPIGAAIIGRR